MEHIACITDDADWQPAESTIVPVFAPSVRHFPDRFALDIVSLPFANLNDQTAERIGALPAARKRPAYCAIFVLDPFTQRETFLDLIGSAGFTGVCNFPPLPRFGKEEREALKASGFSFERELELLSEISLSGFDIAVMCNSSQEFGLARDRLGNLTDVFCLVPDAKVRRTAEK